MKLVFLPEAVEDIDRLYDFLIEKNPVSAQKAMLAIDEGIRLLSDNPAIGVPMDDRPHYHQLFIPFGKSAYVLRYRIHIETDTLAVVRVWHGKEHRNDD